MNTLIDQLPSTTVDTDAQAILEHLMTGKPLDPAIARRVRERGDQIRQEIFERHGVLDVGVPAIRELRGELPQP